jgi:hypothetical protein
MKTKSKYLTETYTSVGEIFLGLQSRDGSPVALEAVKEWLDERLTGYTLREGVGCVPGGDPEPCACILIAGMSQEDLEHLGCEAAGAFDQQSVGLLYETLYISILPVPEKKPLDQLRLSRFKQLLDLGVGFDALPVELKAWWMNRY